MQNAIIPTATLAEFYRFALLLTGQPDAAERVMADTLAEAETRIGELRSERNRNAWLVTKIRNRCAALTVSPDAPVAPRLVREPGESRDVLEIEAFIVARHFRMLPEPERSALALFYIDFFTPEEIAQLLVVSLEELGAIIERSRQLLRESLRPVNV